MKILLIMIMLAMPAFAQEGTPIMGNQAFVLTKHQISELETLALEGDNAAAIKLSRFYGFVTMDSQLDEKWLRIAADRGDTQAQSSLAYLLIIRSEAMQKDALKYLSLATESQNLIAIKRLASIYDQGIGVPANYEKARKAYEVGASLGDRRSMSKLGDYLIKGMGGPINKAEGLMWLFKALKLAPENTVTYSDILSEINQAKSIMSGQEIKAAEKILNGHID